MRSWCDVRRDHLSLCALEKNDPFLIKYNKAKTVPLHATKALGRRGGIAPTQSWLDGEKWSALRPGRALGPEKGTPVPIVQETGWELNIILKEFYEKLLEHLNFHLDWTILTTTLHKSMNTLLTLFQIIAKNAAWNDFSLPE
jgi:hypothetical protein